MPSLLRAATTSTGRLRLALAASLLLLGLLAGLPTAASGNEVIQSFDSLVEIQRNGDYLVTETIRVRAAGSQIQRGIFRDFPTVSRRTSGLVDRFGFAVLEVKRNGEREPWHTESITGGTRIYIGEADVRLPPGEHTYTLRYRTTWQTRFLDDVDEVYWNATGNFWQFPIESATATLLLPDGGRFLAQQHAYTGRVGEQGSDAAITRPADGQLRFSTTRSLAPGEGLTVAAAFPKGIVREPSALARSLRFMGDNRGWLLLLAAVPLIGGYLWTAWSRVGRDPPRGVIIPLFAPPPGISPGAASWIWYRGTGARLRGASRALIAALMSLAVKGRIRFSEPGRKLLIERLAQDSDQPVKLSRGEQVLDQALFAKGKQITISKANANSLRRAVRSFERALDQEYSGTLYRFNHGAIMLGVGASILVMVGFFWLFPATEAQRIAIIAAAVVAFVGGRLSVQGLRRIIGDLSGGSSALGWVMAPIGLMLLMAFLVVLLLPVITGLGLDPFGTEAGGLPVAPDQVLTALGEPLNGLVGNLLDSLLGLLGTGMQALFSNPASVAMALAAFALVLLNLVFAALMFAPTPKGREVADAVAGFRLYLSVAEAERMNLPGRPDFSTELFERYLPYAVGLGVEKPWSKALDAHLARSLSSESRQTYSPRFYAGRSFNAARIGTSTARIASTLGTSFASAMPSSSSASGGGGSSGGGGGGGGGGGW